MYLKRAEITGFKSFAERTKLFFEPGITAVVGPNGCGKSNVVDAIRWGLGEQSTHSLRCRAMLDLIFNGSQKRSPMGMSEVSLVFDNSTNRIPLDFNEITVTRKLFRSGESEFYLNKTQCRLKDIRDLFLDTGIGYEGYSIMEQGKVEFILNAKPEERREMFEEAAGVSKYKARRDEAIRKMERIDIDLSRIQDTIAMVKEQIRQLDLAVRKTKQYQSGIEELKTIEIADFLYQRKQLLSLIEEHTQKLTAQQNALVEQTAALDRHEARIEELRLCLTEKEQSFARTQGAAYKIDSDIALSENRKDSALKKIQELEERKNELSRDIAADSERLLSMVAEYKDIFSALSVLSQELKALEADLSVKEETLRIKTDNIQKKKNEFQALKQNLLKLETESAQFHNDLSLVSSRISRIAGETYTLEKEYGKRAEHDFLLNVSFADVQKKFEENGSMLNNAKEQREKLLSELHAIEQGLADFQGRDDDANQRQLKLCARINALTEQMGSNPYHQGALALLERNGKGIYGPLHRLIQYSDEYRYIAADGLGDYLYYFVSETIAEAEEALQYLKENGKGRARFFILEALPYDTSHPAEFITSEKPLFEIVTCDKRVEHLVRYILQSTYFKGSTIYRDYTIEGGAEYSAEVYTVGAGTLQEKDMLESNLKTIQEERHGFAAELTELNSRFESVSAQVKEIEDILQQNEISHRVIEAEVNTMRDEQHTVEEEMKTLHKELKNFFEQRREFQHQAAVTEKKCVQLDHDSREHRSRTVIIEQELSAEETLFRELNDAVNSVRIRYSQCKERLQHKASEKERIEKQHSDTAFLQVNKEKELVLSEQRILQESSAVEHERTVMDELFKQKEMQDAFVQEEADQKNRIQNELHGLISELNGIKQSVNALRTGVQDAEIEHQKHLFQEKNIIASMNDKYSMTVEDAEKQFEPNLIDSERAARLRSRIASFGSVNLAAPEEYEQLEGRFVFLEKQYQDIVNAKEDLKRVIQKINATTKENFEKTFHQVQENFQKIYKTLFQGGEATLMLTNEENLLETGVDIFAQPPGKKLQNITLLSGGEKALTAAALLFAFFMVRPSPLCILDEVDAPLDEANVTRFIRMIKEFSSETQFLIITHNKRTMEIADTLYGVTMEEFGVSKIISIKFTGGSEETLKKNSDKESAVEKEPAVI